MDPEITAALEALLTRQDELETRIAQQDEVISLLTDLLEETRTKLERVIGDMPVRTAPEDVVNRFLARVARQTELNAGVKGY